MDLTSKRIDKLSQMLPSLITDHDAIMISDGTGSGTFGMIQLMPTIGGIQYGLREVSYRGTGSGQYFQPGQEDDLIIAAIQMIDDAERPHPLTQKLIAEGRMKKPEPLDFHFLTEENMPTALRRMGFKLSKSRHTVEVYNRLSA